MSAALNRSNPFVASAPAPSAATAAREAGSSKQPPFRPPGAAQSIKSTSFHQDPQNNGSDENNNNKDAGQLVAMSSGPRLNPHSALKEFNNYLLQVLDSNDEEKREIIGRLRLVVQAQRSAAAVRDDLMKMTMEFNETARTAEELRLALQESREAQRRLEHENRVLAAQVEDDRAKIASLVKLCRAEMSTKNAALGSNPALDKDDILLSIGNGGRKTTVANRPGASARSAASSSKKPPSVSLRQASAGTPANSTRAEDGSNANDNNDHYNNNNQNNNNNSIATTDIVAQVLQGSHAANQTGPESLVVALRMEADSLKQLLDEQRAAYEASRAAHVRVARDCDRRHYEEGQRMAAEIRSLSDVLVTSTKDLVETRQNANVMQRQLRGEIEGLVQRLSEAEKSKNVQSSRQTEELRVLAASERNKNVNVAERLRAKLSHFESKFHTEKDNLAGEVDRLKEALATAQETAARERRLRLRAEEHARLKSEGHESDLGLLRAQLRTLEKKAFFAHAKDLSEYGSLPPRNAPTEEVDLNVLVDEDGNPIAEGEDGADEGRETLYVGNHHTMQSHGHQIGMDFDEDDGQGTASKRRSVSSIKGREASFNLRGNSLSGAGEEVTAKVTDNNNSRRNSPNNNNNNNNNNTSSNVYHVSGRGGMRYDSGAGVAEVTTGNNAVAAVASSQQHHARSGSNGSLQRPSTAMLS